MPSEFCLIIPALPSLKFCHLTSTLYWHGLNTCASHLTTGYVINSIMWLLQCTYGTHSENLRTSMWVSFIFLVRRNYTIKTRFPLMLLILLALRVRLQHKIKLPLCGKIARRFQAAANSWLKWKRLFNGINPFISVNICLKVWWMNKNPRLIAKYFLDYVQKYGSKFLFSSLF